MTATKYQKELKKLAKIEDRFSQPWKVLLLTILRDFLLIRPTTSLALLRRQFEAAGETTKRAAAATEYVKLHVVAKLLSYAGELVRYGVGARDRLDKNEWDEATLADIQAAAQEVRMPAACMKSLLT
jgi:hypothetical protein